MRKALISIVICLCVISTDLYARRYRPSSAIYNSRVDNTVFHYGYSVGVGVFDYRIDNLQEGGPYGFLAEQVTYKPAFRLGVIGEWNITPYIALRTIPGLYFGKRTITYNKKDFGDRKIESLEFKEYEKYPNTQEAIISSVYADIPFLFKYKGVRINNYNYFLVLGASYHLDLTPHNSINPLRQQIIRTKAHDFALEVGGGVDLYFKYFKLGVELRASIGLIDVMNHEVLKDMPSYGIYTRTIDSMKSTLVTLSFNFE